MVAPKRNNGISVHSSKLLREGEGGNSDFKRTPEGISTEDLVAFANSGAGGSILAGVDECTGQGGVQTGIVVGCDVSDAAILQITNKALSCFPPVAITVITENIRKRPFLRIDVPSSRTKPHCTPKGIYCLRDGTRNRPLHPSELLQIFLESEARVFAERFDSAAERITTTVANLETKLSDSIENMGSQLGWAEYKLDGTESTMDSIFANTRGLNTELKDLTTRIRTIFRQDKRQDPIFDRKRKELIGNLVEQILDSEELRDGIKNGGILEIRSDGDASSTGEFTVDELKIIIGEATKIAREEIEKLDH